MTDTTNTNVSPGALHGLTVIDTGLPAGEDLPETLPRWEPPGAPLESRSLMLLISPAVFQM